MAEYALAKYYLLVKSDMTEEGIKLLIRAALKKDVDAMKLYASLLEEGTLFVDKDSVRAKYWQDWVFYMEVLDEIHRNQEEM